jgi:hypothetical protein
MDSYLVSLIRGEGGALSLSAGERMLLEFALDTFGEPLSQFILAGLGEEAEARSWLFTITFDDERGVGRRRKIKLEPDERPDVITLLPRQREPLVILALLCLLIEDPQRSSSTLSYKQEEVLHLLGWQNTVDACSAIDEAVERYARLSYSWGLSREELTERNLSFYDAEGRFVSSYGHYNGEESGAYKRVSDTVEFSSVFVEGLTRRTLFNVDWDGVSDVNRRVSGS